MQNNISFFPILFHIEKGEIPEKYIFLRNYNMVTIREEQKDIENAINRILDIYIQRDYSQGMNIETTIFETLIRNYCTVESVKNFYNEKIINERNPVIHARINYILICYEEELYLERQAVQYEESMREYSL